MRRLREAITRQGDPDVIRTVRAAGTSSMRRDPCPILSLPGVGPMMRDPLPLQRKAARSAPEGQRLLDAKARLPA